MGVLVWFGENGNRYDGPWEEGLPEGNDTYRWADGSFYVGVWSNKSKDQNGTYYFFSHSGFFWMWIGILKRYLQWTWMIVRYVWGRLFRYPLHRRCWIGLEWKPPIYKKRNERNARLSRPPNGRESNYSRGSNCDSTFEGSDRKSREGDEGLVLRSKIWLLDSSSLEFSQ